jgi:hypothetical protein
MKSPTPYAFSGSNAMDCGSVQDANWEESSQAGFQVTLRAAQDEAVSTGRTQGTTFLAPKE